MADRDFDVVTGAFGYSGKYISARLLARGRAVRTLTNSPGRGDPFAGRVEAHPFDWDRPQALAESLRGARVLYNTYWVRFDHRGFDHATAVDNTLRLFEAARRAGVGRVVHVSITNPSEDSPFPYFRGKARLERALAASGLPHSVLRPAVLFGHEDILINNIAWMLRHLPVFGVFGDGHYRLQPIHVDDFADLAVAEAEAGSDRVIDAIGPETFTYRALVERIAARLGLRRPIIEVPPGLGLAAARLAGRLLHDVTLTRDEIGALMADLLWTPSRPAGATVLSGWLRANAATLGRRYASELARRRDRTASYDTL